MARCWTITQDFMALMGKAPASKRDEILEAHQGIEIKAGPTGAGIWSPEGERIIPLFEGIPLPEEEMTVQVPYGRLTVQKTFLPITRQESETAKDEDLLVHVVGADLITSGSFNHEFDAELRQTVKEYHRLPPRLETAEGDVEVKSLRQEARDAGLWLLAHSLPSKDNARTDSVLRVRKGSTFRVVYPEGELQVQWRFGRPRIFGVHPH